MSEAAALLAWMRALDMGRAESLGDLADGALLCDVMADVAPDLLTSSLIRRELAASQWVLRANNWKRFVKAACEYLHTHGVAYSALESTPFEEIAKEAPGWEDNLVAFLKLLMAVTLLTERTKNKFLGKVLSLDAKAQQRLMLIITNLEKMKSLVSAAASSPAPSAGLQRQVDQLADQVKSLEKQKQHLELAYNDSQSDLDSALAVNNSLQEENKALASSVRDLEQTVERLQQQERQRSEEMEALHAEQRAARGLEIQEMLQSEIEEKEAEVGKLKRKVEELLPFKSEVKAMRDEIDILQQRVEDAAADREKLSVYEAKLESVSSVRERASTAEQAVSDYMKKNMALEDEVKRLRAAKTQLSDVKAQMAQETARLFVVQGEKESLSALLSEAQQRNAAMQEEVRALRAQRDALQQQASTAQESVRATHEFSGESLDGLQAQSELPQEVKMRIATLEAQNERLQRRAEEAERAGEGSSSHAETIEQLRLQVASLQKELASAVQRSTATPPVGASQELQADLDAAESKIAQYEQELKELSSARQQVEVLQRRHADQLEALNELRTELDASNACIANERERSQRLHEKLAQMEATPPSAAAPAPSSPTATPAGGAEGSAGDHSLEQRYLMIQRQLAQTEREMQVMLSALRVSGMELSGGSIKTPVKKDASRMFTAPEM
eukprot:TRINITY_DN4694_c0_g1_i1.p1 TRINITY_DN4694_c0_g1~~TRINITY_DN4694_c0_g1_i1.p1  ORF type:complete len:675 (+),score=202.31 TRINITY_DN4694_c0_g1_i1:189-2213(+)